ncbi:MAG: type II secretion system protein GspG [Kiritimatiellia bacterium]
MSIQFSKPPQPLKMLRRTPKGTIRWRTSEERRIAKRRIDAIRRAAEREHLELTSGRIDLSLLRSPKVIVAILFVLLFVGGLVVSATNRAVTPKNQTPKKIQIATRSLAVLAQAMTYYRVHTKSWPSQQQGLWALARNPKIANWKGPYINAPFRDPWKNPYVYQMPLSPFDAPTLFSCGADGLAKTGDDIHVFPDDFTCDEGTWNERLPLRNSHE